MIARRDFLEQAGPSAASAGAVILTSFALAPTLGDGPWFLSTLTAVLAVAVVGTILRALAWSGWLVTLLQGLALLLLITWMFAGDVARFGFLPGPDVWHEFSALVERGANVINEEVAPITVTDGVRFLVVVGVALIAWAVDAVAVTWRQATVAGIPLLSLYLVPAIVLPDGVPWPLFLLAGAGWLLLLLTDGRRELMRWGRPVEGDPPSRLHSVGGTGRRLGAAALTVAVIVPVILPSLDDGRFGLGSGDGDNGTTGTGNASEDPVTTLNPITDLRRDLRRSPDTLTFTYRTTTPSPDYFRVATLDSFDGFTWRLEALGAASDQQVASGIPDPAGLSDAIARSTSTYDVSIEALSSRRLPMPYPASVVNIDGDWRWDSDTRDVFTPDGDSLGQTYSATQVEVEPRPDQLREAGPPETTDSSLVEVPDKTEAVLADLPEQVTAGAATPYDQALMIQNWFRTEFEYSLDTVGGNDDTALAEFLKDRSGYCEQFAATMALMARMLDIPSRVVVGYTPGERADDGTWQVTAHDAHAWPELWFQGAGWVRFEPTPGGGDGGGTPVYAPTPEEQNPETGGGKGSNNNTGPIVLHRGGGTVNIGKGGKQLLSPDERRINRDVRGGLGVNGTTGGSADEPGSSRLWLLMFLLSVGVVVVLAPAGALRVTRRRRWGSVSTSAAAVEAAWADILDGALDVEIPADPVDTPRDVAMRLPQRCRLSTTATSDVRQLAQWVERLRYSGDVVELPDAADIRERSERVRAEMHKSLSSRDQRQVTWWPASGRRSLAVAWNAASERLGEAIQGISARVRGFFSGRRRGAVPSAPRSGA